MKFYISFIVAFVVSLFIVAIIQQEDGNDNNISFFIKPTEPMNVYEFPSDFQKKAKEWLIKTHGVSENVAISIAKQAENLEHGAMLIAILSQESSGRPRAKLANNYGLCQISTVHLDKKEIARLKSTRFTPIDECGVSSPGDLFSIDKNLCAGNAVFDRLYVENKNNVSQALVSYNANPRHKYVYARKVMNYYKSFAKYAGLSQQYSPNVHRTLYADNAK